MKKSECKKGAKPGNGPCTGGEIKHNITLGKRGDGGNGGGKEIKMNEKGILRNTKR